MKKIHTCLLIMIFLVSCHPAFNKTKLKKDVYETEKAFEKMVADSGVAVAFYTFADSSAVINRANDSIIRGKENIRHFYQHKENKNATVSWTPDFVDVSTDGTLGYTYGKYCWKIQQPDGTNKEFKGTFHTVWKRQPDGSWKYVWD